MTSNPLCLEGISKRFGSKYAVQDVSMTIEHGQIIGFLGPNGAGKTTTLRMALGLVDPDIGSVRLFGRAPGPSSFGRVGFLPEERGLYRKSNAREAVAYLARLNGMDKRSAFRRADEMLEKYGLGEAARHKVKALSKGMAQKVQLIAAIAHDPEFLILDEPFSGLDPVNQTLLEDMVRDIAARGRTIIFSTHIMEHAERLCERIILMSSGRKIFDGTTQQALSHAARRVILELPDSPDISWLEAMSDHIETLGPQLYRLTLKDGADSQNILEGCVSRKSRITRFEPERTSLHDAFVNLVDAGQAGLVMQDLQEGAQNV